MTCEVVGCTKPRRRASAALCEMHYVRRRRHGATNAKMRTGAPPVPPAERFVRFVEVDPSGCWLWTGSLSRTGYGRFQEVPNASPTAAHRFAYELWVGPIPVGLEMDHLCRVRHCVRPDHLEPVTHAENVRRGARARSGT